MTGLNSVSNLLNRIYGFFNGRGIKDHVIEDHVIEDHVIEDHVIEDHGVIKAPHNTSCFTQGLYYDADNVMLYESCAGAGADVSVLRVMRGPDHEVILEKKFPEFLEGITVVGDFIYVLTWKAGFMYVLNKRTLDVVSKCYYEGDGWGLTHDGEYFIMSNGSDRLTWFRIVGEKIEIKKELNIGVQNINELEWVDGHIYANVWYKDELLKISVDDSKVVDVMGLGWLRKYENSKSGVLNGIAYDSVSKMFLVTGKNWEGMYWVNE
jgi:glutaminyl-peptide cyclotransferase